MASRNKQSGGSADERTRREYEDAAHNASTERKDKDVGSAQSEESQKHRRDAA